MSFDSQAQTYLRICEVLCKSGKFETGEGTCALICLDQLGEARKACTHREQIYGALALAIMDTIQTGS